MTKFGKVLIGLFVLVLVLVILVVLQKGPKSEVLAPTENLENLVVENEILGKKEDLIAFTILPGSKISGILEFSGSIKGAWFFEGNILVNVLDENKNVLLNSNATATTDWMTIESVEFEGNFDLTNLPKGKAYIEIKNDNASGEPEFDKSIMIPVEII